MSTHILTIPAHIMTEATRKASDEDQPMRIMKACASAAMNLARMDEGKGWFVRPPGSDTRHWTGRPGIVAAVVQADGHVNVRPGFVAEVSQ